MVFSPHDAREEKNALINFQLLEYVFQQYKAQCIDFMKKNIDFYSYNKDNTHSDALFNRFLIKNYNIYPILSEGIKALLRAEVRVFPHNLPYFFLSDKPFSDYLQQLDSNFQNRSTPVKRNSIWVEGKQLCDQAGDHDLKDMVYHMFITWYAKSWNFDEADVLFDELIKNNLKNFSLQQVTELITSSSQNSQTYERNQAKQDNKLIIQRYLRLNGPYEAIKKTPFESLYVEMLELPF